MPQVPDVVVALTEHYRHNQDVYRTSLNETEVRVQFVDPLFEALGWDIHNKQHYAETYKDVVHEYSLRTGTHTEAPDYCFRVGGVRKFFVEAKRPGVNISTDPAPAFQLRSYAWTSKLPLSFLTNFTHLAVYDSRKAPTAADKAATARIDIFRFDEYVKRWDEIFARFSKEAVYKGAFDRYAESTKSKKGTAEVDQAFLAEIEDWRKELSSNIALRNTLLSQRDLNFAVQRTIDRIIFLRICEDRGIEKYGQLRDLQQGEQVYKRLLAIYKHADEKYNSGLFHFSQEKDRTEEPDSITTALKIDDARLKSILKRLYYPASPYQFSHFPVDILGQVYEQFLGKVIRLTSGRQVKIESKPEVLKAHGVYYTPTYIVDYIVKHAIGSLLAEKTPRQASKLRIIDPACGSGSFLLGAYDFLLNWHRDFYLKEGQVSDSKRLLYQTQGGDWHLTTAEKKRILLNNIYGLDIDSKAVEVTKLSLLLRVLEGENEQTLGSNLRLFHERALPDLGDNVKCGNALIGSDFYSYEQMNLLTDDDKYRVNVFDWRSGFPSVFKLGGFDVVIGNPPYGYMISLPEQSYFASQYHYQDYQKDLYLLFLEKYQQLLRTDGQLGIIVSNTWLQSITYKSIRKHLTSSYDWLRVLLLPQKVFKQATVDTHVIIFKRKGPSSKTPNEEVAVDIRRGGVLVESHVLSPACIPKDGSPINVSHTLEQQQVFQRIRNASVDLASLCTVYNGLKPFETGKGTPPQTEAIVKAQPFVVEGKRPGKEWSPLLRGSLLQKFRIVWNNDYWIKYGPWLAAPRKPQIFTAPKKIMIRQTGDSLIGAIVPDGYYARNNLHILLPDIGDIDLHFLLGLINSKLMNFAYTYMNPEKGEALAEVKKHHVETLPIANGRSGSKHQKIANLVQRMMELRERQLKPLTDQEKAVVEREAQAVELQIDQLVYEMYALSQADIDTIELTLEPAVTQAELNE